MTCYKAPSSVLFSQKGIAMRDGVYTCKKCHYTWRRSQLHTVTSKGSDYQPAWVYYCCPRCKRAIFSEKAQPQWCIKEQRS